MSPKDDNKTTAGGISLVDSKITYNPKEFIDAKSTQTISTVAGRPYYPALKVEKKNTQSVIDAVVTILFHGKDGDQLKEDISSKSKDFVVKEVTGGITNALFRVSGLSSLSAIMGYDCDSVLVRLFGGEGMIDRDVETCTFAALADCGIAPPYYGRFENGRLEGWLEHCVTLSLPDFQVSETNQDIAAKMAELHAGFHVPDELKEWHNEKEPGLWGQLFSWMEQAKGITEYKTESDNDRAKALLDLNILEKELNWVKSVISDDCAVGFCHNDLLPANVMKDELSGKVKLIDFEYGGVNFIAFDIANHFNEWAGGPDNDEGKTDYNLFPTLDQQKAFISSYVEAASSGSESNSSMDNDQKMESLLEEVKTFVLANHLYWGLWAVNQAAVEGTEEFDYMAYAVNRFNRYFETK